MRRARNTSPLCRSIPEGVKSMAGTNGSWPSVYMPVESGPSPALLYRSNLMATLLPIPGDPPYPRSTPVNAQFFTSDFTFQLTNAQADGFTICIQNQGPTALGTAGGDLGYGGSPGICSSVAINFALYNNAGEGPDSTGIYTDGQDPFVPAIDLTPSGIDLHSGDVLRARLIYYNPFLTLEIVDTTDGTKSFATQFPIDIPATTGGNTAYVGFTGGTGGLAAIQEILTWDHLSYAGNIAALPAFNPPAGTYTGAQHVSITDATPGATIYYTTDGTTPTTSSTKYTGPVAISASTTLKALAVATGYLNSSVATASYTIQ